MPSKAISYQQFDSCVDDGGKPDFTVARCQSMPEPPMLRTKTQQSHRPRARTQSFSSKFQDLPRIVDGRPSDLEFSQSRPRLFTWMGCRQLSRWNSEADVIINLYHLDKVTGFL